MELDTFLFEEEGVFCETTIFFMEYKIMKTKGPLIQPVNGTDAHLHWQGIWLILKKLTVTHFFSSNRFHLYLKGMLDIIVLLENPANRY